MSEDDGIERRQGVLAEWNDDRGFGFITPAGGRSRVFAHVSAFPRGRRPAVGCEVTYVEGQDDRNRARASQVRFLGVHPARSGGTSGTPLALTGSALFFAILIGLWLSGEVPVVVLAAYVLISASTFLLYGAGKSAAQQGSWRTSEATLHTVALAGGWPGALIARQVFRHKTIKQPFRTIFWVTVFVNCVALVWFIHDAPLTLP